MTETTIAADDNIVRYYEVELTFMQETGVMVPVTAKSVEEAEAYAKQLFREAPDLKIKSVRDISQQTTAFAAPPSTLLN